MGEIILTSISKSELEDIITRTVQKVLVKVPAIDNGEEQIFNQKQAAKFLGITESTLISWKKTGKVPYEQLQGSSKIRFYKSQLKLVLMQNPGLLQAARK